MINMSINDLQRNWFFSFFLLIKKKKKKIDTLVQSDVNNHHPSLYSGNLHRINWM